MSDINVSTQYSCPISTRGRTIPVRYQREHAIFMSDINTRTHHSCPVSSRGRTIHVRCQRADAPFMSDINVNVKTLMFDINVNTQHPCLISTRPRNIHIRYQRKRATFMSDMNVRMQHLYDIHNQQWAIAPPPPLVPTVGYRTTTSSGTHSGLPHRHKSTSRVLRHQSWHTLSLLSLVCTDQK